MSPTAGATTLVARRSTRFTAWVRAWRAGLVPFDDLGTERSAIEDKFRRTAAALWSPAVADDALRRLARFEDEPSVRAFVADLGRG